MVFEIKKNADGSAQWTMVNPERVENRAKFYEEDVKWYDGSVRHCSAAQMAADNATDFCYENFGDIDDAYYRYERGHSCNSEYICGVIVDMKSDRDFRRMSTYEDGDSTPDWLKDHVIYFG